MYQQIQFEEKLKSGWVFGYCLISLAEKGGYTAEEEWFMGKEDIKISNWDMLICASVVVRESEHTQHSVQSHGFPHISYGVWME